MADTDKSGADKDRRASERRAAKLPIAHHDRRQDQRRSGADRRAAQRD
jgi:hypothetical protein